MHWGTCLCMCAGDEVDADEVVELRPGVVDMRSCLQDAQARSPVLERDFAEAVGKDRTDIDVP